MSSTTTKKRTTAKKASAKKSTTVKKKKNAGARPVKINERVLAAFDKVLDTYMAPIILTDAELIFEVNELLEPKDKFSDKAFEDWKLFANGKKTAEDTSPQNYALYLQIRGRMKKALITQKQNLFAKMANTEDKNWTRWAWIIERKFDEWNIRQKVDVESNNLNRNVNADVDQLKKLSSEDLNKIESILLGADDSTDAG